MAVSGHLAKRSTQIGKRRRFVDFPTFSWRFALFKCRCLCGAVCTLCARGTKDTTRMIALLIWLQPPRRGWRGEIKSKLVTPAAWWDVYVQGGTNLGNRRHMVSTHISNYMLPFTGVLCVRYGRPTESDTSLWLQQPCLARLAGNLERKVVTPEAWCMMRRVWCVCERRYNLGDMSYMVCTYEQRCGGAGVHERFCLFVCSKWRILSWCCPPSMKRSELLY